MRLTWAELLSLPNFTKEKTVFTTRDSNVAFLHYLHTHVDLNEEINYETIVPVLSELNKDLEAYRKTTMISYDSNALMGDFRHNLRDMQLHGIEVACLRIIKAYLYKGKPGQHLEQILEKGSIKIVRCLLESTDDELCTGYEKISVSLSSALMKYDSETISLLIQYQAYTPPDQSFLTSDPCSNIRKSYDDDVCVCRGSVSSLEYFNNDLGITYFTLNAIQIFLQTQLSNDQNGINTEEWFPNRMLSRIQATTKNLKDLSEYLEKAKKDLEAILLLTISLLIIPLAKMVFEYVELYKITSLHPKYINPLVHPNKLLTSDISLTNHYALYSKSKEKMSESKSTTTQLDIAPKPQSQNPATKS